MSVTPARRLAADVLSRVTADAAWVNPALEQALTSSRLDDRDRAFAARLVRGTVETLATLDAAIDRAADRPGRIRPRVRDSLRLSVYELLFMDTPSAVAVSQGVSLVASRDPHARAFANALLRRVAADADSFPWGDPASDPDALALVAGFPSSLRERIEAAVGAADARTVMEAGLDPAPVYVAANPFRGPVADTLLVLRQAGAGPVVCEPPGCIRLEDPSAAIRAGLIEDGTVIVADASAQLVASLVPLHDGATVFDLAAGRGTKTALLAFRAYREGIDISLVAADVHEFKTAALETRLKMLGVERVRAVACDCTDDRLARAAVGDGLDAVLVDAPCSGLGTLRRHPEIKTRFTNASLDELVDTSSALLRTAARLVRPGGFVVYSTCSVLPMENAAVVGGFLGSNEGEGFRVVPVSDRVPDGVRDRVSSEGFLQTLPARGGPDGHFAALLERRD